MTETESQTNRQTDRQTDKKTEKKKKVELDIPDSSKTAPNNYTCDRTQSPLLILQRDSSEPEEMRTGRQQSTVTPITHTVTHSLAPI